MHEQSIPNDQAPSRTVFESVATHRECEPTELPPLGETIDTDALDALVAASSGLDTFSATFRYAGCIVTVTQESVTVVDSGDDEE